MQHKTIVNLQPHHNCFPFLLHGDVRCRYLLLSVWLTVSFDKDISFQALSKWRAVEDRYFQDPRNTAFWIEEAALNLRQDPTIPVGKMNASAAAAASFSHTLVLAQVTRSAIPKKGDLHDHMTFDLKSSSLWAWSEEIFRTGRLCCWKMKILLIF